MRRVVVCEVEEALFSGNFWEPFIRRFVGKKPYRRLLLRHFPAWLAAHRSHEARVRFDKALWNEVMDGCAYRHIEESLSLWGLTCRMKCRKTLHERLYRHMQQGDAVYLVTTGLEAWAARLFIGYRPLVLGNRARRSEGMTEKGFEFDDCTGPSARKRFMQQEACRKSYRLTVYATKRHRELLAEADEAYLLHRCLKWSFFKKIEVRR